jgi:hypothetical protein
VRSATRSRILVGLVVTALAGGLGAASPTQKCEQAKLKGLAKLLQCRNKADQKALKKETSPDYAKCQASFESKWLKAEDKADGACPSSGDVAAARTMVEAQSAELVVRAKSECSVLDQDCPENGQACYMNLRDNVAGYQGERFCLNNLIGSGQGEDCGNVNGCDEGLGCLLIHKNQASQFVCAQFCNASQPLSACSNLGPAFVCVSLRLFYGDFKGSELHEGICLDPADYGGL